MIRTAFIFALWLTSICGDNELEGFIVNGTLSNITEFSYSIYLKIKIPKTTWTCGSSILNQLILLTAAHCVNDVKIRGGAITAHYGNVNKKMGQPVFINQFIVHPHYTETDTANDVAVLRMATPIPLTDSVGRVAIFEAKDTPYQEIGVIAGWGLIDEVNNMSPTRLRHISQDIKIHNKCEVMINKHLPAGIICGGKKKATSYVAQGDSGSALVVKGYIQVGIVSYKDLTVDTAICMYSDVGYFYEWIEDSAVSLFCAYLDEIHEEEEKDLTL